MRPWKAISLKRPAYGVPEEVRTAYKIHGMNCSMSSYHESLDPFRIDEGGSHDLTYSLDERKVHSYDKRNSPGHLVRFVISLLLSLGMLANAR